MNDVAREARVSVATVSRTLNGGAVTASTRSRVVEAIDRLGYRRNDLARSLVTGRSGVIGVLIPDMIGPLYGEIAQGIEEVLRPRGLQAMMITDNRDPQQERATMELLLARQIEGLINVGSQLGDDELAALTGRVPVVMIQREGPGSRFPALALDNRRGIELGLDHLLGRGHRNIVHLSGVRRDGRERLTAYLDLMRERGGTILTLEGDSTEAAGQAAATWLVAHPEVSAVLCTNDRTAFGLYRGLKDVGIRIPDDLSVVGFDDLPWGIYLDPPLTTVRQPGREMGRAAAEIVVGERQAPPGTPTIIHPTLTERASVASVAPAPTPRR